MTMTAKFAGTCKSCNRRFEAGAQINWERGQGAQHIHCPGFKLTPGYYTPEERTEIAEFNAIERETEEREFWTDWTREATIERRARWNAAKVYPYEYRSEGGYCERVDMNVNDLQRAIRHYGL